MFFVLYVADYELSCLQLLTYGSCLGSINVSRDFKITLTKNYRKSPASNARVNFKNGTIIEMLFLNVSITVESLFLLYLQEKFGAFFSYNLHLAIRVPHMRRKITWLIWIPNVFKMAAKIEFSKNYAKKNKFRRYIGNFTKERYYMPLGSHRELKKQGNFPESCSLMILIIILIKYLHWTFK